MIFMIVLILELFAQISGAIVTSHDFTILSNKIPQLNLIVEMEVRSSIECAVECSANELCSRATFNASVCSLFQETIGSDINLIDEEETQYICKYE